MSDFVIVPIGGLGEIVTGKTPSSACPEDYNGDCLFVTPSDSWDQKYISTTARSLSAIGVKKLLGKLLPPRSIMVSCIGSDMGKVCLNQSEAITNQQINAIIVDTDKYDVDYLHYKLVSAYTTLRRAATGSTSLPLLNKTDFSALPIRLHQSKAEQHRIASVLSALDAKIALNTRINAELEALAKLIYDYWFVQFDFPISAAQAKRMGKPKLAGQPYKSSGGAMVHNQELKRAVPEGWEVKPLLEEMDVQYGFPFDTNQFTEDTKAKPVVRIRDILGCSFSAYSTQDVHEKYALRTSDLLIGMDGNFHMNYWDRDAGYLNQRSVRIRSPKGSSISTVQCLYDIQPHIKAREASVSRTTVGHLSDKDLKRMYVLVPEESKVFQPKQTFDGLLALMLSNRIQNQELTALRDWLLPLLMNGQVVVGEAEEKVGMAMAAEPAGRYGKKQG